MPVPNLHRHLAVESNRHRHLEAPVRHRHLKCRFNLGGTGTSTGTSVTEAVPAPKAPVHPDRQGFSFDKFTDDHVTQKVTDDPFLL